MPFDQEHPLMIREPVFEGDDRAEQRQLDDQLRPQRLDEVIGQREVIERLKIVLDAARKRGEPLGHILFDGPPGLGKTTFATVLPREMGTTCQIASGPALKAPKDLLPYLTNAAEGSVLFIDEIHRLPRAVEEFIYPAMEDFRIDIVLGEGVNARTLNLRLKRFTLVGATTRSGLLTAPLRDRFQMREHLDFYTVEELAEIVRRSARKLATPIAGEAALELARRSRGTPRIANSRLRWVRDYATSKSDGRVTLELARAALEMQGIDEKGLDHQDRRYLDTLIRVFCGGPAGVEALAHTMNLAVDTLCDEVEPYLLRLEFIVRTPRGRKATDAGYRHLGRDPESPDNPQRTLF
jgi:Holliday junction DNA helicase RuvB